MNIRVWIIGGVAMRGENCSTQTKTFPSVTLFTLLSWNEDEIVKHRRWWEHNHCVRYHLKPGIKQSIHGSFCWNPFLIDKITTEYLSWEKLIHL